MDDIEGILLENQRIWADLANLFSNTLKEIQLEDSKKTK